MNERLAVNLNGTSVIRSFAALRMTSGASEMLRCALHDALTARFDIVQPSPPSPYPPIPYHPIFRLQK